MALQAVAPAVPQGYHLAGSIGAAPGAVTQPVAQPQATAVATPAPTVTTPTQDLLAQLAQQHQQQLAQAQAAPVAPTMETFAQRQADINNRAGYTAAGHAPWYSQINTATPQGQATIARQNWQESVRPYLQYKADMARSNAIIQARQQAANNQPGFNLVQAAPTLLRLGMSLL